MRTIFTKLLIIAALFLSAPNLQAQYGGTMGALTWTLTADSTLTISGSGPMPDYGYYPLPSPPWQQDFGDFQLVEYIKTVVIEPGVTTIGNLAFEYCINLTSVTIPDGVTSIGELAFGECIKLPSITIPGSVTTIKFGAFCYCRMLTSMALPEGLQTIGGNVFYECTALTSIAIPNTVTSMGTFTFGRCISLQSVTIGAGLTQIPSHTFYLCSGLTSITIPNNITNIENSAFGYCTSLNTVSIGAGVTSIAGYVFTSCSALTALRVNTAAPPAALNLTGINQANCILYAPNGATAAYRAAAYWQNFTTIREEAASGATGSLFWIFTTDGTLIIYGIGAIPNYFFNPVGPVSPWYSNASSIQRVVIQEGVTAIGDFAFNQNYPGYTALTRVSIPNSVTSIGWCAFNGCRFLDSVIIPAGVTHIGISAFAQTGFSSITIPAGITRIEDGAFNSPNLASVTFLGAITSIGEGAFLSSGLTSITIPNSVTSIGAYAFYHCTKLTSIIIPNNVTSIGNNAFYECSKLASVTIGSGLTYYGLGMSAFMYCSALTTVRILALTPPFISNLAEVFDEIIPGRVLEVPSESKNRYMAAAGWNAFATINEIVDPDLASAVQSASIASATSITVNGVITNSSSAAKSARYYCIYGTDPNNLNQTIAAQSGTVPANGSLNVSATLTGLTGETLYYYKLIAEGNRSALSKQFLSSSIPTNNLKLWLRADMAVTSTGSAVSAWGDVSGWNNDASQSASGNQPTFAEGEISAKPALVFNGSTSKLMLPASSSLGIQNSPYEMFIVAKSASGDIQFLIAGGATEQFEYHLNGAAGARFIPIALQFIDQGAAGYYTSGNAHVFSARASAVGGAVRVDGIDGAAPTGNLLSANSGSLMLGARSDNSYYLNGNIAEVIIYNTNLSTADRSKVENYLSSRYNITSGALPVELSSFTGAYGAQKVELKWTTAAEINNNGFKVERRAEKSGNADWEQIGFVQGYGNSNSHRNYAYTDKTPPCGKVSYRLRQVDSDGKYQFSGILELVIDLPVQNSLSQNYPNPFNPTTTIRYQLSNKADVSLIVYDMAGREAAVLASGQKSPGYYEAEFNGSKLASGIYVYKLKAGSFIQTKKLLLLK